MDGFQHVPTAEQLAVYHLSDAELIEGARQGKDAHIGVLRQKYGPAVYAAVSRVLSTDASEVLDDVFLDLPKLLVGYEERGSFVTWLRVVARYRARTAARRQARDWAPVTDLPDADVLPGKFPSRSRSHDLREIREKVMAVLDERERAVCELSAAGYRHREIAERLGISEANSAQLLSRARKKVLARFAELT